MAEEKTAEDQAAEALQTQLTAARDLLIQQGFNVLDNAAFAKIRQEAAAKAVKDAEAARQQSESTAAELQAARARLKAIDDAGKTEDQLWKERQIEWQRQLEQAKSETLQERKVSEEREAAYRTAARDRKLQELLSANATNPRAALLCALDSMPGLKADESGRLVLTDAAGIDHVGEAAEAKIQTWWSDQKWLHRAPAPGPATHGGANAPAPKDGPVYPQGADSRTRQEIAQSYEDARRLTGRAT
jgi:hypothetical protein